MAIYRLDVDGNEPVADVAETLALLASGVFYNAHPEQWREGMEALAEAIRRFVRHDADSNDEPGLRVIQGGEEEL